MVKIKHKDAYIGSRIAKHLESKVDKWANDHLKSKSEIIEFALNKFINDVKCQEEFLRKWCRDGEHC